MGLINDSLEKNRKENEKRDRTREKYAEFVDLYATFKKAIAWNAKMVEQGYDISDKMPKFKRLSNRVDMIWDKFSDEEKRECQKILIEEGLFEPIVKEAIEIFNGTVTDITGK
jgi:hypothetical protein